MTNTGQGEQLPLPLLLRFCPHCGFELEAGKIIYWGGWIFDEESNWLTNESKSFAMHFPVSEARLLAALLRAKGAICRKDGALYMAICAGRPDCDWPEQKIVDVYICKMRRKLREYGYTGPFIATDWGRGYGMQARVEV